MACPRGACPTGPIALKKSSDNPDLYSKTIELMGTGWGSWTGPTAGPYPGRAIRMIASSPVSVTALVRSSRKGSGASVIMPANALGTSYMIPSLPASSQVHHFIVLVAGDMATTVTLPKVPSGVQPFTNTGPQTITLQPYDTYLIRTANSSFGSSSLSGLLLNGMSRFAVVAGYTCVAIPADGRCAYVRTFTSCLPCQPYA